MQKLILISLLIFSSSKLSTLEFGKEFSFNKDNKEFEFTCQKTGNLFFYLIFKSSQTITFTLYEGENKRKIITSNNYEKGSIFRITKGNVYKIIFEFEDENDQGIIWVNPSYNKINVNLNESYQWKFDSINKNVGLDPLIYAVENAEKNVTFKFEYNSKIYDDDDKVDINIENPFEVCQGDDCKNNTETYDFKEGESYTIKVNVAKKTIGTKEKYILPAFSIHDINKKVDPDGPGGNSFCLRFNLWVISLILLII